MTSFLVIRMEGEIPDPIARVAMEATSGVIRAYMHLAPANEMKVDVELLDGETPEGKQRRRKSVMDRLYAEGWDR